MGKYRFYDAENSGTAALLFSELTENPRTRNHHHHHSSAKRLGLVACSSLSATA